MTKVRFPGPCAACGRTEPSGYYTRKLCKNCYRMTKRRAAGIGPGREKKWVGPCLACGTMQPGTGGYINRMCRTCNRRVSRGGSPKRRQKFNGPCIVCGLRDKDVMYSRKMCENCYMRVRNGGNVIPRKKYTGPCIECGSPTSISGRFYNKLCKSCDTRLYTARKKASVAKVESTLTAEQWRSVLLFYHFHCAYCGGDVKDAYTMDHVVPISKGGKNTIDNVVPCCIACNSGKRDRLPTKPIVVLTTTNEVKVLAFD